MSDVSQEVQTIYGRRFAQNRAYRQKVWHALTGDFFQPLINPAGSVLDLGCGYGEFINQILAREKYGMDLNPDAARMLTPGVRYFQQDCSRTWPLPENALDSVFTSNFFEHLPDKATLGLTLEEAGDGTSSARMMLVGGLLPLCQDRCRVDLGTHPEIIDDPGLEECAVSIDQVHDDEFAACI